ncbi:hypothetical protein P9112_013050 [Eukaryota sp. TZLM1-RC]
MQTLLTIGSIKNLHLIDPGLYVLLIMVPYASNCNVKRASFRPSQPRLHTQTDQSGLLTSFLPSLSDLSSTVQNHINSIASSNDISPDSYTLFSSKCVEIHYRGVSEQINDLFSFSLPSPPPLAHFILLYNPSLNNEAREVDLSEFVFATSTCLSLSPNHNHYHVPLLFTDLSYYCCFSITLHFNLNDQTNREFLNTISSHYPGDLNFALFKFNSFNSWSEVCHVLSTCCGLVNKCLLTETAKSRSIGFRSIFPSFLSSCHVISDLYLSEIRQESHGINISDNFSSLIQTQVPTLSPDLLETSFFKSNVIYCTKSQIKSPRKSCGKHHQMFLLYGLGGKASDMFYWKTLLSIYTSCDVIILNSITDFSRNLTDLTDTLAEELSSHLKKLPKNTKISFLGHSLGAVLIRSVLSSPNIQKFSKNFHTFISLAGPHLGIELNSFLVKSGIFLMKTFTRQRSLSDLQLRKPINLSCRKPVENDCFMSNLAQRGSELGNFKNILLFGSQQDGFVPYTSSLLTLVDEVTNDCEANINSACSVLLARISSGKLIENVYRFDVVFSEHNLSKTCQSKLDHLAGKAAHVAFLVDLQFITTSIHSIMHLLDE